MNMFSGEIYQERRKTLIKEMKSGLLVFVGNDDMPMNFADNAFPFRQDSSFLYYFGIQEPKLVAVIDADSGRSIIYGDELTIDQIVWMGRQETLADKAKRAFVFETRPLREVFDVVQKASKDGRTIHYLPPYSDTTRYFLSQLTQEPIGSLEPSVELINAVVQQRSTKQPEEIEEIEKAVNISNEMHLRVMENAFPGIKEYELIAIEEKWATRNRSRFSYPAIMTINGQILHNHYSLNTLKEGNMVLNDSGVETAMGYAGDLTRTFPVGKRFTSRQKDMYDLVVKAFEDAQGILKPGLNFKEVQRKAALTLTQGMIDMGIFKGNAEDAVANDVFTLIFQCGVGHMMGLDVHDMESLGEQYVGYTPEEPKDTKAFGWKSLRLGRPVQSGFVVTVEPGIYMIPELMDIWKTENKHREFVNYEKLDEYRDFGGIRVEDDFLITDDGYRRLGNGLIYKREDVEEVRAKALEG